MLFFVVIITQTYSFSKTYQAGYLKEFYFMYIKLQQYYTHRQLSPNLLFTMHQNKFH